MAEPFRWGILGTGNIAKKFATGLTALPGAELTAVGSRAQETADAFGDQFGIRKRHASYGDLAGDAEVDAIYVSTPHPFHMPNSILCLEAGKPTLCEKPFAINRREAEEVVAVARQKGVFLMEAMWTRFLPITVQVRAWLEEGAIGEARMLHADFGFRANVNPEARLFNPSLGGGGLLDVGVYTVSFASMVFGGPPAEVVSSAHLGETGVDEQAGMILRYGDGQLALLSCAVRTRTPHAATIMGTEGMISLHPSFWSGREATLTSGGKNETIERPFEGNGYGCEAEEVERCVRVGKLESNVMPLDETLAIMSTLDELRSQWGLTYPME